GNQVLVGRRSANVTQFPGHWEFVGSGSLELYKTPIEQLAEELREEAGIADNEIECISCLGAVYDEVSRSLDLCVVVRLRDYKANLHSTEYEEVKFVQIPWLLSTPDNVLPTSAKIAEQITDTIRSF